MHGYTENKANYHRRLRRIEGQIRGLQKMIENDEYCIDILTQVSAATRALQSVSIALLDEHLRHCVSDATNQGGDNADDKITEASNAIARLVKDRTTILIAHRLATLERADDILLMDDGAVAEHGSRDELAANPRSRFAQLLRLGAAAEEVLA